ncbi:MAG: RNA polymerase sigma factor [Fluviicola sp.]
MSDNKQEEFLTLYEPVHERFERFCRARVYGNMDYRDLLNESLLVAYDKLDTLRSKEAFLSFLIGISVRILSNNHQKKKEERWSVATEKDKQDFTIGVSDPDVHFLYEGLSHLKEEQRECLILFEISGFSIKEIAVIQNASESAIKQRLKRGRDKLKDILTFESSHKTGKAL